LFADSHRYSPARSDGVIDQLRMKKQQIIDNPDIVDEDWLFGMMLLI
jgi:hypothetical protein